MCEDIVDISETIQIEENCNTDTVQLENYNTGVEVIIVFIFQTYFKILPNYNHKKNMYFKGL